MNEMKRRNANYLNMAKAVLIHLEGDKNQWQSNGLLFGCYVRIKGLCTEIEKAETGKELQNTVGHTEAKDHAHDEIEEKILTLGLRLRAFARLTKNEVVGAKVKELSHTYLARQNFNNFLTISRSIIETCQGYLSQLADYKITAETLDSLQKGIDKLSNLYAHRDNVQDQHMQSASHIEELFVDLRHEMKLMDDLMEAFIENKDFLDVYMNSRRIHDLRGHKQIKNEDVKL